MITYMVTREIEGIGLSGKAGQELAAARSAAAVSQLAPRIEWCHSWIGADSLLSLYRAGCIGDILDHARFARFPDGNIARVLAEIPSDDVAWLNLLQPNRQARRRTWR